MVSVIGVAIVSYNTRDLLRNCLRSVIASAHSQLQISVVVVDNASQDGSAQMVADEFPTVNLLAAHENLGFTGGNNLALAFLGFDSGKYGEQLRSAPALSGARGGSDGRIRTADGTLAAPEFVLLLNSDAELTEDAPLQMVHFLEETADAGACGPRLQYRDGRFQHGAFRFPNLFQVALDFFPFARLPGAQRLHDSRFNGRYPRRFWEGERPFPVDFVLGASMMVRSQAIRSVGVLDDAYFMYCEEMDWCMRLKEAGWGIYALPAAHVIHHEGQSSRQVRWRAYEWLWRSRFRFYTRHRRHYPRGYRWLLRRLVRLGLKVRSRQAQRRFAHGEITGTELRDELAAYAAVARM